MRKGRRYLFFFGLSHILAIIHAHILRCCWGLNKNESIIKTINNKTSHAKTKKKHQNNIFKNQNTKK
jgi:hypothetical protein